MRFEIDTAEASRMIETQIGITQEELLEHACEAAINWLRNCGRWAWKDRLAEKLMPRFNRTLREFALRLEKTGDLSDEQVVQSLIKTLRDDVARAGVRAAQATAEPLETYPVVP